MGYCVLLVVIMSQEELYSIPLLNAIEQIIDQIELRMREKKRRRDKIESSSQRGSPPKVPIIQ